MKYLGLALLIIMCLLVVAFVYADADVTPTGGYTGHKVIQDPYPAPVTETPAPYPAPVTPAPTVKPTFMPTLMVKGS